MASKAELIELFPIPLLITKYENDFTEELEFIKNLEYGRKNESESKNKQYLNLQSTDTFLLDKPELKNIREFIEKSISTYTNEVLFMKNTLTITQSWANKNEKGDSHHLHSHPNSFLSGVFYFQINEKMSPIEFSKDKDPYSMEIKSFNKFNSHTFLLPLNSGELILFPSHLNHRVPENNSDEIRISMSFNTFFKDYAGSIDSLTYLPIKK